MKEKVRAIIKKIIPLKQRDIIRETIAIMRWLSRDKVGVASPPFIKRSLIKRYGKKYGCTTLVETGTYYGDSTFAVRNSFRQIFSIEFDPKFYQMAEQRFRNYRNIKIIEGDSGKVLPELVPSIDEPVIFYLDGHNCSKATLQPDLNTPIIEELDTIFSKTKNRYVILIDDARDFTGKNDYPALANLEKYVKDKKPDFGFKVTADTIIITPPK
jgi:hypothetical protein